LEYNEWPPAVKDERPVRNVLLVISSLEYSGPARVLSLAAAGLRNERLRVCVLGEPSPWCDDLRAAGVDVEVLGWRRALDLRPLLSLRALIRTGRPRVIHAWGFEAAWPLVLTGSCRPSNLMLGTALPPRRLSVIERWFLKHCGRVVAVGQAEAEAYQRVGVPAGRIVVAPPGVAVPADLPAPAQLPGLPETGRVVLAVGPLTRHKGHREAVWAFDILRCLYDDVHLVIAGTGPDEERVRRFAQTIRLANVVHFPGPVRDLGPWLARAELVWIPSLHEGGRQTALEAMAAGRPVVASRLGGLEEVVLNGQTGYLVAPGDKAELARQTRILLDHPDARRRMGEAARQHVEERFALAAMIEGFTRAYE
jgi:glycosyltransferase involved in cell wall biosynthesis